MGVPKRASWIRRVLGRMRWRLLGARSLHARGDRDEVGRLGEQLAEGYLAGLDWRIVDRNVRLPMGEADLVAMDEAGVYVVVEVKTRVRDAGSGAWTSSKSGMISPFASIDARKRRKLRSLLACLRASRGWTRCRVDGVGVTLVRDAGGRLREREIVLARNIA